MPAWTAGPVAYEKATTESPNPLARFSHRRRFRVATALLRKYVDTDGACLDFGAGSGAFLLNLRADGHKGPLYAYDAHDATKSDAFSRLADLSAIDSETLSAVTALETLEHLRETELNAFCAFVPKALRSGGYLIVSVPIMIGPVLFLKYGNARYVNRSPWRYTLSELIRGGIFLKDVPRDPQGTYLNHKGFDFRRLREKLLATGLTLVSEQYSPFPFAGFRFNSQVFFVLQK